MLRFDPIAIAKHHISKSGIPLDKFSVTLEEAEDAFGIITITCQENGQSKSYPKTSRWASYHQDLQKIEEDFSSAEKIKTIYGIENLSLLRQ